METGETDLESFAGLDTSASALVNLSCAFSAVSDQLSPDDRTALAEMLYKRFRRIVSTADEKLEELAWVLLALQEHLPDTDVRQHASAIGGRIVTEVVTPQSDTVARWTLVPKNVSALRLIADHLDESERSQIADTITIRLLAEVPRANDVAPLARAFVSLSAYRDGDDVVESMMQVLACDASQLDAWRSPGDQLKYSRHVPNVEQFLLGLLNDKESRFEADELVEVLKTPVCVGSTRIACLQRLSSALKLAETFKTRWRMVDWLAENDEQLHASTSCPPIRSCG